MSRTYWCVNGVGSRAAVEIGMLTCCGNVAPGVIVRSL
jgi:hypothetical protein